MNWPIAVELHLCSVRNIVQLREIGVEAAHGKLETNKSHAQKGHKVG